MDKKEKLLKEIQDTRNSLSTDRLDMSFGEIMSMYDRKEIIIDPEFQRLFRWNSSQKTKFIESILLGIPIPPIFVAEDDKGKWELVDGLQRISTFLSFFSKLDKLPDKNNWKLEKGELIKSFEGMGWEDLPTKFQLNLKRSVCRVEIIKWDSEYDMRYELFNRLNTGGSTLTDQEIRNCIFRGVSDDFNKFLSRTSSQEDFISLIQPTEKQKEELYLDELVLRYCSLLNNKHSIKENISQHMTDYMREIVKIPEMISDLEKNTNRMIKLLSPLGTKIFRGANNVLSTSLFDCITVGVGENLDYYEENAEELETKIEKIKEDEEFKKASGSASNSKTRIVKRLEVADRIFKPTE